MHKILLSALLASVAIPAFAADMPVKAPIREPILYTDWSGIYVGGAAGFGWGREKLSNQIGSIDNLFGTGVGRVFEPNVGTILQPDFDTGVCVIDNCNSLKQRGFIGGGFAGAQKQLGNWVIGIEGSWDWANLKKSISETTVETGADVIRFLPNTQFQVGPLSVNAGGSLTIPGQNITSVGSLTIGAQTITSKGEIVINGQDITSKGAITIGGQKIDSTGKLDIPGQLVNLCLNETCVPGKIDIPIVGTVSAEVPKQTVTVNVTGNTATATIDVVVNGKTEKATIPVTVTGQTASVTLPVTVDGKTTTTTLPITVTGTTGTQQITLGLPREVTAKATVTRSVELDSKIDQLMDIRGKVGLTNVFFGPNILLYATGGATVGHFQKTLSLTQTTALIGGGSRTNDFTSSTGDTRLGWVVGAGLDWKMTQNVILGVLYRHHEFPKGTVAFNDEGGQGRALSFGTSRASIDSVQGRLSVLFPIQ